MPNACIVVVEDEGITAKEIEQLLTGMGYDVPGLAKTGAEALALVEDHRPDLVLMDIQLKGEMDGVEAAGQVRARFGIPVVYLTANADRETVARASETTAFGYIVKPFHKEELRANVEIALSTHRQEQGARERLREVGDVLNRVGDAVVTANARGQVTYMNAAARAFANPDPQADDPRDVAALFRVVGAGSAHPVQRALRNDQVAPGTEATLALRDGRRQRIENVTVAPIYRDGGAAVGAVWVFHEANGSGVRDEAEAMRRTNAEVEERLHLIETLLGDLGLNEDQLEAVVERMRGRV